MKPSVVMSSAMADKPLEKSNEIYPLTPNPTADELEAFQIALAHKELAKLDKRQTSGCDVNLPAPDTVARRATLRLRLRSEQVKRKPVLKRRNNQPSNNKTSSPQGSTERKPGDRESTSEGSSDTPERIHLFEDIRHMICDLCFSNAFIDRIPKMHPGYAIKKAARQLRDILDGDRRRFHGQVYFDLSCFHDVITRDEKVPNKGLEGKNVALRWSLARFIWDIICKNILLELGDIDEKEVAWQTAEHIQGATRPFLNRKKNERPLFDWFYHIASVSVTLRKMLTADSTAQYLFKLPPNAVGSCVGDGSPQHAQMINMHGEKSQAISKIHSVLFGALVRRVRGTNRVLGPPKVEYPAWVAEYSLGDF